MMKRNLVIFTNRSTPLLGREKKRDCTRYSFGPLLLDIDVYFLPIELKRSCRFTIDGQK